MQRKKRNTFDKTGMGFLAGFLLPLVVFLLVYVFGESDVPFSEYVGGLWRLQALIKLVSLCIFANLLIFTGFLKIKYEQAARGVLGATIVYALAVLISKAF